MSYVDRLGMARATFLQNREPLTLRLKPAALELRRPRQAPALAPRRAFVARAAGFWERRRAGVIVQSIFTPRVAA
jgi:hypothetical protein